MTGHEEFRLECLRLAVQFGGGQDAVILARRYSDYVLDVGPRAVSTPRKKKEGPYYLSEEQRLAAVERGQRIGALARARAAEKREARNREENAA